MHYIEFCTDTEVMCKQYRFFISRELDLHDLKCVIGPEPFVGTELNIRTCTLLSSPISIALNPPHITDHIEPFHISHIKSLDMRSIMRWANGLILSRTGCINIGPIARLTQSRIGASFLSKIFLNIAVSNYM